jgi:predicted PurR-regulated permease PerM
MNDSGGAGAFAAPAWLRGAGTASWLLVGVLLIVVGAVTLLALTDVIVMPVLAATVAAAVTSPLVSWLERHGIPRLPGTILLLLAIVLLAALVVYVVIAGITSQTADMEGYLDDATSTLSGWLEDLGADPGTAAEAESEAGSSASGAVSALLGGVAAGISALSSLGFFLALTLLCLIFMLKDGREIRAWVESQMGVPAATARTVTQRALEALRNYFLGTTIVAAFNAVVVGLGAWILGVPLAGAIAVITFFAAYVPYVGAWTAGAFSVLLALGGAGTDAAVGMAVVQLLANGALQQMVQPFAMGAALNIHPLAVLIVTIGGGALFGTAGLILAAPVTSAVVKISADLTSSEPGDG